MVRASLHTLLLGFSIALAFCSYGQELLQMNPLKWGNSDRSEIALAWDGKQVWIAREAPASVISDALQNQPSHYELEQFMFAGVFDSLGRVQKKTLDARNYPSDLGSLSISGDNIYFSAGAKRVKGIKNGIALVSAPIDGSQESEILLYREGYRIMHPSVSLDGSQIYFSADFPEGKGGMDLYVINRQANGWCDPIALADLNSAGNDVFPQIHEGDLYFSSDREGGMGGLDLYKSARALQRTRAEILPQPFNSPQDDFNLLWLDNTHAYMSSNRNEGSSDDIFVLRFEEDEKFKQSLKMRLVCNDIGLPLKAYVLLNDRGITLQKGRSDSKGFVLVEDVTFPQNLELRLAQWDERLKQCLQLHIYDDAGNVVLVVELNGNDSFVFEFLAFESYPAITLLDDAGAGFLKLRMSGLLKGATEMLDSEPVMVLDKNEKLLAIAYTRDGGVFEVDKLRPEEVYIFQLDPKSNATQIQILDGEAPLLIDLSKDKRASYKRSDQKEMLEIRSGEEVLLLSKDDFFVIKDLRYAFGSDQLMSGAQIELDKLSRILIENPAMRISLTSHTDSRGQAKDNLALSQARSESAKRYLQKQGIAVDRITAVGKGESQLLNNCQDGVACSEEEHAINRRTEIRLVF